MQIDFPLDGPNPKPTFTTLSSFSIPGQVMNVFLLDPIQKLFAAFIFLQGPTAIGLYCLPNWDNPEYIFIDTCIQCVSPPARDIPAACSYLNSTSHPTGRVSWKKTRSSCIAKIRMGSRNISSP